MRLHQHVLASTLVSAGLYAGTRSLPIALSSFIVGVFIDLDHVIDYWREHPFRMDLVHFFETCEEFNLVKTFLFLHSAELIIPLGFIAFFSRDPWVLGILLGFSQHLLFDHLVNPVYPFSYSFFYRMGKGFYHEKVFNLASLVKKNEQNPLSGQS